MELLSEVVQSSALSEADIEQQRGVVLRELEEVEGSLQDVCMDLLYATAFQGTPMGQSVLGPSDNARYTPTCTGASSGARASTHCYPFVSETEPAFVRDTHLSLSPQDLDSPGHG